MNAVFAFCNGKNSGYIEHNSLPFFLDAFAAAGSPQALAALVPCATAHATLLFAATHESIPTAQSLSINDLHKSTLRRADGKRIPLLVSEIKWHQGEYQASYLFFDSGQLACLSGANFATISTKHRAAERLHDRHSNATADKNCTNMCSFVRLP